MEQDLEGELGPRPKFAKSKFKRAPVGKKRRRDWDKANYLRQQRLAQLEEQKQELEEKEQSEARDNMLASLQNKIDELKATTLTDDNLPSPAALTQQDSYPQL